MTSADWDLSHTSLLTICLQKFYLGGQVREQISFSSPKVCRSPSDGANDPFGLVIFQKKIQWCCRWVGGVPVSTSPHSGTVPRPSSPFVRRGVAR